MYWQDHISCKSHIWRPHSIQNPIMLYHQEHNNMSKMSIAQNRVFSHRCNSEVRPFHLHELHPDTKTSTFPFLVRKTVVKCNVKLYIVYYERTAQTHCSTLNRVRVKDSDFSHDVIFWEKKCWCWTKRLFGALLKIVTFPPEFVPLCVVCINFTIGNLRF